MGRYDGLAGDCAKVHRTGTKALIVGTLSLSTRPALAKVRHSFITTTDKVSTALGERKYFCVLRKINEVEKSSNQ